MVCFDSSTVIDFLDGNEELGQKLLDRKISLDKISITAVTLYELLRGNHKKDMVKLYTFLSNSKVYVVDVPSAGIAADIYNKTKAEGKMMSDDDILIAATAIANDDMLIARDIGFSAVKDKHIIVL